MKRFFNILAIALISATLTSPSAEAQGRNGHGSQQTSQHRNAPASGSHSERGNKSNGGARGNANGGAHGNSSRPERPASGSQHKVNPAENKRPGQEIGRPADNTSLRKNHSATPSQVNATKATPATGTNRPGNNGSTRPGNGGNGHDNNSATRPGGNNNNRPDNNGGSARPGNNGNNRPGNGGSTRPGQNGNHRPSDGGNHGGNNFTGPNNGGNHNSGKPNHGGGNHNPGKPGTPPPPAYGYGPGGDRWHGNFHDIPHHAPHRPMLPPPPPHFYRPVPPPAFRPAPNGPRFGTILGIALGSAINYTLNQLFNSGYYVTGYTNNAVYLNDVMMLNIVWPNATLQYSGGRLNGSEFVYPSAFYDTDIYYNVYNTLQASYGIPVSMDYLSGGGMQATWFGIDGRYVNLTFQGGTAVDGQLRYYTTLSFGN